MNRYAATPERFAQIIESIYDAAADETSWRDVVRDVSTACGGFGGCLMLLDTTRNCVPTYHQFGYADETWREYSNHYVRFDPGVTVIGERPDMVFFSDATLGTTADVMRKNEMYDWLFKVSDQRHAFGARLFSGSGYESLLLIARSRLQGEASSGDMRALALFEPHLRRSITLARKFGERPSILALDAMPFGVVILDEFGCVSFSNTAMAKIVAEGDGMRLTRHGLHLAAPDEDAAYRRLIERIRRRSLFEEIPARTALAASRPSGKRPYSIVACPFPRRNTLAHEFNRATTLICVSDPTHVGHLTEEVLVALFDLSPAEARLTISLVKCGALSAAAIECSLTEGSARQYPPPPAQGIGDVRAIVIISNAIAGATPNIQVLAAVFGLTPAEARLAAALVRTGHLAAAAENCQLTTGSARQYMKRIYEKTGTTGQVDLVRVVGGSKII